MGQIWMSWVLIVEADSVSLVVPSLPLCSFHRMTFPKRGDSFFKGSPGADFPSENLNQFSKVIGRRHIY